MLRLRKKAPKHSRTTAWLIKMPRGHKQPAEMRRGHIFPVYGDLFNEKPLLCAKAYSLWAPAPREDRTSRVANVLKHNTNPLAQLSRSQSVSQQTCAQFHWTDRYDSALHSTAQFDAKQTNKAFHSAWRRINNNHHPKWLLEEFSQMRGEKKGHMQLGFVFHVLRKKLVDFSFKQTLHMFLIIVRPTWWFTAGWVDVSQPWQPCFSIFCLFLFVSPPVCLPSPLLVRDCLWLVDVPPFFSHELHLVSNLLVRHSIRTPSCVADTFLSALVAELCVSGSCAAVHFVFGLFFLVTRWNNIFSSSPQKKKKKLIHCVNCLPIFRGAQRKHLMFVLHKAALSLKPISTRETAFWVQFGLRFVFWFLPQHHHHAQNRCMMVLQVPFLFPLLHVRLPVVNIRDHLVHKCTLFTLEAAKMKTEHKEKSCVEWEFAAPY